MPAWMFDNGFSAYLSVCAILLFNGGAWLSVKRMRLCFGQRAEGEVVGYVERMQHRAGSRPTFMPKVSYASLQHGQQQFVSRMSASPRRWPVGTRLPVAFLSSHPATAEIATPARLWMAPAMVWIMAAGVLFAALKG
jgi:hypothetical protein